MLASEIWFGATRRAASQRANARAQEVSRVFRGRRVGGIVSKTPDWGSLIFQA